MLKIIGGSAKSRIIKQKPHARELRPISSRIKKSLFDILRPRLARARFLDLYAGTGAVGMEALSRGAKSATFVEIDRAAVELIEWNLKTLQMTDRSRVYQWDVLEQLRLLTGTFHLIFMGPPYKNSGKHALSLVSPTLVRIHQNNLLDPVGQVIAQHHKKEIIELPSPEWMVTRLEKYGDSYLSFLNKTG